MVDFNVGDVYYNKMLLRNELLFSVFLKDIPHIKKKGNWLNRKSGVNEILAGFLSFNSGTLKMR